MRHATLVLNQLWRLLIRTSVLAYPDPNKLSIMVTHASDGGRGTVLSEEEDSGEIMGCSALLKMKLRNFCLSGLEQLVVVQAVKHFLLYLFNH